MEAQEGKTAVTYGMENQGGRSCRMEDSMDMQRAEDQSAFIWEESPGETFWKVRDQIIPKAHFMFPPDRVDQPHNTQDTRQNHQEGMTFVV